MQKALKGTQSEKNLLTAFVTESQAQNRYTYFIGKAKKWGKGISAVGTAPQRVQNK